MKTFFDKVHKFWENGNLNFSILNYKIQIMGKEALKEKIIEYLADADEILISQVNDLICAYQKSIIVGYRPDGTAITKEQLLTDIKIAEQQIKEGKYITAEDLKEEIKKWRK